MSLLLEPFTCGSNAILEYLTKTVIPGTESEYCDPEYTTVSTFIQLSIEQTRNSREMEQSGSTADIIYARGRILTRGCCASALCLEQAEYCIKYKNTPCTLIIGRARVLPEVSSRLGLERVFGNHIQLEIQLDDIQKVI